MWIFTALSSSLQLSIWADVRYKAVRGHTALTHHIDGEQGRWRLFSLDLVFHVSITTYWFSSIRTHASFQVILRKLGWGEKWKASGSTEQFSEDRPVLLSVLRSGTSLVSGPGVVINSNTTHTASTQGAASSHTASYWRLIQSFARCGMWWLVVDWNTTPMVVHNILMIISYRDIKVLYEDFSMLWGKQEEGGQPHH